MAEIPVHKKEGSSLSWLWILLGLLVLALILWLVLSNEDDNRVVGVEGDTVATAPVVPVETTPLDNTVTPVEPVAATTTATGPITDLSELTGANLGTMVGRQVNLRNAPVVSVPNDQGFFIGSGPANRVFVAFDEVPSPGQPGKEGQVDVNNGSTVEIVGEVVNKAADASARLARPLPAGVDAHIHASRVAVVNK